MRIILLFTCMLLYGFINGQDFPTTKGDDKDISVKLKMMYGIIFKQFMISPNYCLSNKNEISFGILYRHTEIAYIIDWKRVPGVAKYYGFNLGYIPITKNEKKICIRNEFNLMMSLVYTKIHTTGKEQIFTPVLLGVIYWGPNLKIRLSNKINVCIQYQLGIGYGTTSSSGIVAVEPIGTRLYTELLPSVDLQYNFNKKNR